MSATPPTVAEFEAALPEGWRVEIKQFSEGWAAHASSALHGSATIGPKRKLVPADIVFLRKRVDDVIAPALSYSQWLAAGQRAGFASAEETFSYGAVQEYIKDGYAQGYPSHLTYVIRGPAPFSGSEYGNEKQAQDVVAELNRLHASAVACSDTPLTRGLRLLAICIERGDVDAGDVAQALFKADTYTVQCPVAAALNGDANVAELDALLADAAKQYGYPFDWEALTEDKE
jgi:hypothetical protein